MYKLLNPCESDSLLTTEGDFQVSPKIGVKRHIGLFSACTMTLGAIIGSGIYITPISVLRYMGSPGGALLVWMGSGVIASIGALCYAELGTMFPQSGSDFTYVRNCSGELPAFLLLWVNVIVIIPAGKAIGALTFAHYVLEPFFLQCVVPQNLVRLIAAMVLSRYIFNNVNNIIA